MPEPVGADPEPLVVADDAAVEHEEQATTTAARATTEARAVERRWATIRSHGDLRPTALPFPSSSG